MMALVSVTGVDALLDDLRDLARLPDRVIDGILNAEADALVQAQRDEIKRQWKGPYSEDISSKSIKKDKKIKRSGSGRYINVYPQGSRKRGKKSVRNAEIAFINEYGAPGRGIAARPALGTAAVQKMEEVVEAGEQVYRDYLNSKNL